MKNILEYLRTQPKKVGIAVLLLLCLGAAAWKISDVRKSDASQLGVSKSMANIGTESVAPGYIGRVGAPAQVPVDYVGTLPVPSPQTAGKTAADVDQKIVKNGYLQLVVDKVSVAAEQAGRIATSRGGFVQSSTVTERGDGSHSGDVSVRVPVAKFEEAMSELKKLSTLVKTETATGQDVTEQYTDLQAQLRNARAQEDTYLSILKQAKTVADTLQVQQQIGAIRGTIESLEGRIQYLANTTSLSTISVSLEEEPLVRAPTRGFRPLVIVKEAVQTLVAAFQGILAGLIWIVIVWGGILILPILIIWLVLKLRKRNRAPVTEKR